MDYSECSNGPGKFFGILFAIILITYLILIFTGVIERDSCDSYHNGDEWVSDCK
jgi:hypothetical protein